LFFVFRSSFRRHSSSFFSPLTARRSSSRGRAGGAVSTISQSARHNPMIVISSHAFAITLSAAASSKPTRPDKALNDTKLNAKTSTSPVSLPPVRSSGSRPTNLPSHNGCRCDEIFRFENAAASRTCETWLGRFVPVSLGKFVVGPGNDLRGSTRQKIHVQRLSAVILVVRGQAANAVENFINQSVSKLCTIHYCLRPCSSRSCPNRFKIHGA